ncbi:MAG: hypothetical protein H6560_25020 [Lewinellaceae bacterium]|nr:hypothetical protein [Lewinellaceae bacterium]
MTAAPVCSTYFGDPCDDGDNTTINDMVDGDCNCTGTPTACTGIGDADGDGICDDVDCDDADPNITTQPGDACDDGNPATINDVIGSDCNCAGTLNTCPGVGDADGDGICADVDCDDSDPAITSQVGDACDDGDPNTQGETIQGDCSCGGAFTEPSSVCASINASSDDAEERVNDEGCPSTAATWNCAPMVKPTGGAEVQQPQYPQGANIVSAYIQFTVDETRIEDPCQITIYYHTADNAPTFTDVDGDISSRARTKASSSRNFAGMAVRRRCLRYQLTLGIEAIVQEIVNRPGYSQASSIAFILEGTGRRAAESFEGNAGAPQLCIEFFATPPDYDCNTLQAFFGDPCDDGDNTTINDMVDGDCNCTGTPTACTGIGDADGDGICANADCDDSDPNITTQPGDACDDGNPATVSDVIGPDCNCAGTLNTCPGVGDNDGDGICSDVDCDDSDPNITVQAGDACDDGDPNTVGETIQDDCSCGGGISAPTQACSMISDGSDDVEENIASGDVDRGSSDIELVLTPPREAR